MTKTKEGSGWRMTKLWTAEEEVFHPNGFDRARISFGRASVIPAERVTRGAGNPGGLFVLYLAAIRIKTGILRGKMPRE